MTCQTKKSSRSRTTTYRIHYTLEGATGFLSNHTTTVTGNNQDLTEAVEELEADRRVYAVTKTEIISD